MKTKVPTADDFLQDSLLSHFYNDDLGKMCCFSDEVQTAMVEFAKLHVEAALRAAASVANDWENSGELAPEILDSYHLDNIN